MTNISWTSIATNVTKCVSLSNTITQDLQTLSDPNSSFSEDEIIAQQLQAIASGNDSRFSSICASTNSDWVNFQSGFTVALTQVLDTFPVSLPVTVNGQTELVSTNLAGQPITLANFTQAATSFGIQISVPFENFYPTIEASFLSPDQTVAIDASLARCAQTGISATGTVDGLTYTIDPTGDGSLKVSFSGSLATFGGNSSFSVLRGSIEPLVNFLAENL